MLSNIKRHFNLYFTVAQFHRIRRSHDSPHTTHTYTHKLDTCNAIDFLRCSHFTSHTFQMQNEYADAHTHFRNLLRKWKRKPLDKKLLISKFWLYFIRRRLDFFHWRWLEAGGAVQSWTTFDVDSVYLRFSSRRCSTGVEPVNVVFWRLRVAIYFVGAVLGIGFQFSKWHFLFTGIQQGLGQKCIKLWSALESITHLNIHLMVDLFTLRYQWRCKFSFCFAISSHSRTFVD